jgi:phage FluMu protein Com
MLKHQENKGFIRTEWDFFRKVSNMALERIKCLKCGKIIKFANGTAFDNYSLVKWTKCEKCKETVTSR